MTASSSWAPTFTIETGYTSLTRVGSATNWRTSVLELAKLDWLKTNPEWQGICMPEDEVVTRRPTRKATVDLLR